MTPEIAIIGTLAIGLLLTVAYLRARNSSRQLALAIAEDRASQNTCRWLFSCAVNTVILSGLVGLMMWFIWSELLSWN